MRIYSTSLLVILAFLAGCNKQKYEDFLEPDSYPINIINYSGSDEDGEDVDEGQNLLINGGLEKWGSFMPYDMP